MKVLRVAVPLGICAVAALALPTVIEFGVGLHPRPPISTSYTEALAYDQAKIAYWGTIVVALSFVLTALSALLSAFTLRAQRKAVEAQADDSYRQHPPRLILHQIQMPVKPGPLVGRILIQNMGAAEAHVTRSDIRVLLDTHLPQKHPTSDERKFDSFCEYNPRIKAGGGYWWNIDAALVTLSPSDFESVRRGSKKVFVLGVLECKDRVGVLRLTLFCREYDPISDRFKPIGEDLDYEYIH